MLLKKLTFHYLISADEYDDDSGSYVDLLRIGKNGDHWLGLSAYGGISCAHTRQEFYRRYKKWAKRC